MRRGASVVDTHLCIDRRALNADEHDTSVVDAKYTHNHPADGLECIMSKLQDKNDDCAYPLANTFSQRQRVAGGWYKWRNRVWNEKVV